MKRYKYIFSNKSKDKLVRLRAQKFEKEDKKNYMLQKFVDKFFFSIYIVLLFTIFLLISINISLDHIGKFLSIIITITGIIVIMILLGIIVAWPYVLVTKKIPHKPLPRVTKEMIRKANKRILRYYKVSNNYRITKCYDCSNELWINKDVLLYFYKGKLRLLNDLTSTIKDIGCYEFSENEINYYYDKKDQLITTVIIGNEVSFVLGRLAKPFIHRGFRGDISE